MKVTAAWALVVEVEAGAVEIIKEVEAQELALNVAKRVICHVNAHLLGVVAEDLELVSNVVKKATFLENVPQLEVIVAQ